MQSRDARTQQHPRVGASRDPDATIAFLKMKEFHLDLHPREARQFDFVASALYLPSSYIGYIHYGAATTVRVPDERTRDDYFIHLPIEGAAEVTNRAGTVVCDSRHGVISSPSGHVMRAERGSSRLTVSLTKSEVMGHLAALLGHTPKVALEFAAAIDLNSVAGRRFNRQVRMAIAGLNDPAPVHNPTMAGMYEQLIMTELLLSQPNNYTNELHRLETRVASRDVQRAVDYIQGHLRSPLTLAEIAVASGIPGRTLLKHFKDHWGTSPMRYLRTARLTRVREALLRDERAGSITDVALAWGFQHLVRFSI